MEVSATLTIARYVYYIVNVENLRLTSRLASSEFLRGLQSISGTDLTGGNIRAEQLGLARSYAIFVYTVCSRPFDGSTSCSDYFVGSWFNPQSTLRLQERGLAIDFPNSYESAVDFYRDTSYFLGIGIILALSANVFTFIFGGLARKFTSVRYVPAIMSLLAAVILAAEASLALRVSRRMVEALGSGSDIGIDASLGPMIYFLFATMAVSFLATFLQFFSCGWRNKGQSTKRPRYPRFAGPPEDPAADKPSTYDSKRSLKQVLSWRPHRYQKVDEQSQQRPISMQPLRPQDEASLLRPDADERD
ncbi:hypothetical protein CC79DRAFT_1359860 [Sarocladium strictum]